MLVADRYRLDTAIGRGGMGQVWRASDEVLGRAVAVKLLLGGESDGQATARFRLEAQTAARLNHPHVVTVFDFGSWDDRFYLVMELVEGISLAQDLAAGGVLSPQRVADIAAQAAAWPAAAHSQGVIHRDIKPGNLMQDAHGTVKIADFGIARFVDDASAALTSAGQIVGTSLYLAPERALGKPAAPASDMYALGCVLYQLLVGEPPFRADNAAAVLHMHVDTPPAPPSLRRPELPGAFEAYLLRLLAKQPEDRPSAEEAAAWFAGPAWHGDLRQIPPPDMPATATVYALPPTTRPPTTMPPAPAGSRRRAPQRRQRAAVDAQQVHLRLRAHLRKHKMLTTVVAGVVAFVTALLLGATWFSSNDSDSGSKLPGVDPLGYRPPTISGFSTPASSPSRNLPISPIAGQEEPGKPEHGKKHRGDDHRRARWLRNREPTPLAVGFGQHLLITAPELSVKTDTGAGGTG